MLVYFRDRANNGKLAVMDVLTDQGHEEAILLVQESLVAGGTGYDNPVLALIHGGAQ